MTSHWAPIVEDHDVPDDDEARILRSSNLLSLSGDLAAAYDVLRPLRDAQKSRNRKEVVDTAVELLTQLHRLDEIPGWNTPRLGVVVAPPAADERADERQLASFLLRLHATPRCLFTWRRLAAALERLAPRFAREHALMTKSLIPILELRDRPVNASVGALKSRRFDLLGLNADDCELMRLDWDFVTEPADAPARIRGVIQHALCGNVMESFGGGERFSRQESA